jgi:PPK2 family polyphosphate:nucleotide phosphotransferase
MKLKSPHLIKPHTRVSLAKLSATDTSPYKSEDAAALVLPKHRDALDKLQEVLYASQKKSVLIVLQGMDTAGKDGTIRHIFSGINPQGCDVTPFKAPTPLEARHDFLWRAHAAVPARGMIGIFNRSHYEDVLVTRVHKLIDKAVWTDRYQCIRDFETLLVENKTTILKFFLHVGKEEQLARFAQRLEDPARNWKISEADYSERALWDDYVEAYEDAIAATSTPKAPWYAIPSNHKWFRNLAVSQIMADTMEELKLGFPSPSVNLSDIRRKYHAAVKQEKAGRKKA